MRPSLQSSYIRSARQKHAAQRSYFDDDSEDELLASVNASVAPVETEDGDVDPLDAFMEQVHSTIQNTPASTTEPKPEIVSEQLYDDYESYYNANDKPANEVTVLVQALRTSLTFIGC